LERTDLLIAEDYIEEIGRMNGLHTIASIAPEVRGALLVNKRQFYSEKIRHVLLAQGFSEVITSSFANKDTIQLQNALASDKTCLRSTITKNITKALDQNFTYNDLLGITEVALFEIGTVFDKTESSVSEHVVVTLGVRTKGNGYHPKDDAAVQAACELLNTMLGVVMDWQIGKGVAEADFTKALLTLPQPAAYDVYEVKPAATYAPVSIYPAVSRDVALWVTEGEVADVVASVIRNAAGDLCVRLQMFDTFTKEGRTSYAFRLVFQSFDRTLTDIEVGEQMEKIYAVLKEKQWEVR
jgi:phenylalanyl-tRNA synthetase beta subunit